MTALLSINGVSAGYDRRTVISDVSIEIEPGEIVALIGHNGGGKTTLMRTIVGTLPARGGTVVFEGRDVSRLSASARVGRGLCLVPQIGNTFPDLTIRENLELSAHVRYRNPAERRSAIAEVHEVFPVLDERGRQYARQLSGGQRQMLALGIALLKQPRLLLLDEPSPGLVAGACETPP
ncbi:MAG: ATP-binding cassette domain-containing protein [Galbitalea sp.]